MGQFITDDVDELIKLGHGDQERLSRIKSEYLTKKLVTLEDRRYVEGLIQNQKRKELYLRHRKSRRTDLR
jgi:hypothetical protein